MAVFRHCEEQSHKRVSTDHNNSFEESGEPKRNRTEAFLPTNLTNALPLGRTGLLAFFR